MIIFCYLSWPVPLRPVSPFVPSPFVPYYIRPHQSLDYLTPYEYYQRWLKEHKPKLSLM
jgi:hypothetical protein